jgi:hypothetical protein
VREALCFGWIDGQAKPLDATRSQRLLTPRKPTSKWSGPNKARTTDLTAAGLMHPAGQGHGRACQADGYLDSAGRQAVLGCISAIDAPGDSRMDWIGQKARNSSEPDRGDSAAGGAERPGQPVAACLVPFQGLKNGPGIEDAERVQGFLDRQ